jgi:predicted naringenin-chalcone synthase
MPAFIHHIATEVPEFSYSQEMACRRMQGWARSNRTRRILEMVYERSGIQKRHSVSGDFQCETGGPLFATLPDGSLAAPGTAERNVLYASASREMSVKLAARALQECGAFSKEDVTHVIFASCTGFANPGPDYHIVRGLGLRESVQRYTLGFMGCYAAFPALRMASTICEANPDAVVLVMCLEFCSLHLQVSDEPDSIVANSLFADGAACALVSARPPTPGRAAYQLSGFHSALIPSSESHMAWEIGNQGFNMALSSYVPDLIGANVRTLIEDTLRQRGLSRDDVNQWAVHPGGRAILDKVQASLALDPAALDIPRQVLRDYGNMSSATILFVLKEMLAAKETSGACTLGMAFGPGLTVELALLDRVLLPAPAGDAARVRHHLMLETASI